ncbi:unnamed protein product, partial [Laminaria digitata]
NLCGDGEIATSGRIHQRRAVDVETYEYKTSSHRVRVRRALVRIVAQHEQTLKTLPTGTSHMSPRQVVDRERENVDVWTRSHGWLAMISCHTPLVFFIGRRRGCIRLYRKITLPLG